MQIVILQLVPLSPIHRAIGGHSQPRSKKLDPHAVERDFQRMRLPQTHDAVVVSGKPDADLILAVNRENVAYARAPSRPERQPVKAIGLGHLRGNPVDLGGHRDSRVAGDSEPADLVRGRQIAL